MRQGAEWLLAAMPGEMARATPFPPPTGFYHGAPGMAFVLDRVYRETGDARYREAAREVVSWLHRQAMASADSGWTTFNDILFGDAGTALLARVTGDSGWRIYVKAADVAIRRIGIPGEPSWHDSPDVDLDRRFGLAGVGDFYLDRFDQTGDSAALQAATRIADHILSSAAGTGDTLHWIQPRHAFMTDPGAPGELTGYLHGAVGYGLLFLRLDAALRHGRWTLRLPDAL